MKFDQNNLAALFYRGRCFIKIENFQNAIEDLTKVINKKPEFIDSYFYRANARASVQTYKQIKEAIYDYTAVINNDSSDGVSFFLRGYCYLLLKQENHAILDWRKSKELGIVNGDEGNWKKDYYG